MRGTFARSAQVEHGCDSWRALLYRRETTRFLTCGLRTKAHRLPPVCGGGLPRAEPVAGCGLDWRYAVEPVSFLGFTFKAQSVTSRSILLQFITHDSSGKLCELETWRGHMLPSAVVRGRRNPLYKGLAARLKKARKAAFVSFDSVAEAAGLTDGNTVFQLERKEGHVPRLDTVEKIARALALSPAYLAYGIVGDAHLIDHLGCGGVSGRLHTARQARGLTMRALARAAKLTDTAVRTTETGASMPNVATVEALAKALDVPPGWLAFGVGSAGAELTA